MTLATDILAEGKTKILKPGTAPDELIVTFKDAATAFNGKKYAEIPGKGSLNARISTLLFRQLEAAGIPTCFIRPGATANEMVYQALQMIPLEVVVRNAAYGSMVKRFGLNEGEAFAQPIVEFFYKSNDDPLIADDLILALQLVPSTCTLEAIRRMALQINEVFVALFSARGILCADFKLEFGLDKTDKLVLGDELSPDNFRLRDTKTGDILDKDVFRLDVGDLATTYQHLLERLEQDAAPLAKTTQTYTAEVFVQSRKNILNPESKAIQDGLHALGYSNIQQLRAGKRFVFTLEAKSLLDAEAQARQLSADVLSNPVVEDYDLRIRP